jgi:hypothetical protein
MIAELPKVGGVAAPTAGRPFSRAVGDQPVVRVRGSQEISDRILLELFEILHVRRRLAHWRRTAEATGTDSTIGLSSP